MSRRSLPAIAVVAMTLAVCLSFVRPGSRAQAYEPTCPGTAPGIYCLQTDMFGTNMLPPVNTQAWGFYRFFFNSTRTEADVTVDVKGLSNTLVTGADIHLGSTSSLGPVLYHVSDGGFIVTGVHMRFSPNDLQQMSAGQWWVTVSSQYNPGGEMRGQVILPPDFFPNAPAPQPQPLPQPVIQLPPQPLDIQTIANAPPPPAGSLPEGVIPADPNAGVPGAAAGFQLFEECRPGASVRMRLNWVNSGLGPQWVDVSPSNDDFTDAYMSDGPVAPTARTVTTDGLAQSTWYYLRVNTLTQDGTWIPSQTIAFYTRNDCR